MQQQETPESRAASTILQRAIKFEVNGKSYAAPPPTIGTLIAVSSELSKLPSGILSEEDVILSSLRFAPHARHVARAIAIFFLGAKAADEAAAPKWWQRIFGVKAEEAVERKTREILYTFSPTELLNIMPQIFRAMEVQDFFALTTFLAEINTTKATKVSATTARGR